MGYESLGRVLAEMAADDQDRAEMAEAVADWLTAGEGIERIDLAGVQRFVWYELPVKWMGNAGLRRRALEAAVELFDRLGMARYAEVCRSPVTTEIHDAYVESREKGIKAFQRAYRRSGIDPPDLDDFVWGDVMGVEEAVARRAAERALEEAMTVGRFALGARGWKSVAMEVTAAVLDAPHPDLPGQTRRTALLTERLEKWLRRLERRGPQLHALRSRHVNRLLHPIAVPADVVERIEPVSWFLDRVDQGADLTQAGYLPTAMVREGWERFAWELGWTDRPPRTEMEVIRLHELHRLLRRLGAVRRRGRVLGLSPRGRRMRNDPEASWRAVAAGLSDGDWARAVAEVFTLLQLGGDQLDEELEVPAATILGESGWHLDGEPPDTRAVATAWWTTRRPLEALGGVEGGGDWRSRTTRLTDFGEATLLEQIRVEATGPRPGPW